MVRIETRWSPGGRIYMENNFFFLFVVLELELRAHTLNHSASRFLKAKSFFEIGSHGTICPGWLRTVILLISAS
jgi:hypothetical protein